jgi:hypothetical protein
MDRMRVKDTSDPFFVYLQGLHFFDPVVVNTFYNASAKYDLPQSTLLSDFAAWLAKLPADASCDGVLRSMAVCSPKVVLTREFKSLPAAITKRIPNAKSIIARAVYVQSAILGLSKSNYIFDLCALRGLSLLITDKKFAPRREESPSQSAIQLLNSANENYEDFKVFLFSSQLDDERAFVVFKGQEDALLVFLLRRSPIAMIIADDFCRFAAALDKSDRKPASICALFNWLKSVMADQSVIGNSSDTPPIDQHETSQ